MLQSKVAVTVASVCVITLAGYAMSAYASQSHTVSAQLIDDALAGYGDYGRDLLVYAHFTVPGKIYIYFIDEIDRSSIDLDRVHLIGCAGDDCVIFPLAGQRIDGGDEYVTEIGITLPNRGQDVLWSDMRLNVVLQDGAYTSQEGSPNPPESTAVRMIGERHPDMLKRVEYEPDRNELILHFNEAINTNSIHKRYISIVADGFQNVLTLSGQEPARVAEDKTYVVFELAQQDHDKLLAAANPAVEIQRGAYERAWDRLAASGDRMWIKMLDGVDPTEGIADMLLPIHGYYKRDDNRIAKLTAVTESNADATVYSIDEVPTKFGASAHYATDDNILVLDLGEAIDRFSIYVSRIHIYNGFEIISLSASEFVRVGDDERSVFFELSPHNRYVMSFMTEPSFITEPAILLEPGAFSSPDGVTESGVRRVPLEVSGAAVFLLDPTVPADVLLGRAEYSLARDTGELVLHFREAIDTSSINTDLITIVNDGCSGIALSEREIVSVGKDKKSIVFGIDAIDALALADMRSAWIRLEQGAFATANGTVNDAGDVPLYNSLFSLPPYIPEPPAPALRIPCLITYGVQPPSVVLSEDDYSRGFIATYTKMVMSAVHDGLNAWSKSNPDITLKRTTTGTPAVIVRWHEPNAVLLHGYFGYGYNNCLHYQCEIGMSLEYRNCQGGMNVLDYDTIRNIVAHEFGHNLGLLHHHSYDHLMAGVDHNVQVPFDDLGYNMPRLPSWDTVYGNDNLC